jgi:hypothetical protein
VTEKLGICREQLKDKIKVQINRPYPSVLDFSKIQFELDF